jgi:hypothetical protein
MSSPRSAVLFDIDGTLVDTNWFHTFAWFKAMQDIGLALDLAVKANDPYAQAFALGVEASICHLRRDVEGAGRAADACVRISQQQLFPYWEAWGEIFSAWAASMAGDADAVDRIRDGLARYHATGATQLELYARTLIAEAQLRHGTPAEALVTLGGELDNRDASAQYILVETYLVRARANAAMGRHDAATEDLQRAVDTAARQQAPMFELRARLAAAAQASSPADASLHRQKIRSLLDQVSVEAGSEDMKALAGLMH